jgi:hypothetical protein
LETINGGKYTFFAFAKIAKENEQWIHLWCSQDVLVLKVIANVLQEQLTLSKPCTHIKGNGGLKRTVAEAQAQLKGYRYVCKTDVKGYYESIDQFLLLNQIC